MYHYGLFRTRAGWFPGEKDNEVSERYASRHGVKLPKQVIYMCLQEGGGQTVVTRFIESVPISGHNFTENRFLQLSVARK